MIRVISAKTMADKKILYEIAGTSTDTKPDGKDICTGSFFIEVDTANVYFFDEDSETWIKVSGES